MKKTRKLVIAGLLIALAVAGSTFSIPVFGSKCSPVQHMVNVISAVILGPWYGITMGFLAALLRICFGLGTFMAFPGSMCGALVAGICYKYFKNIPSACIGELFGTSIIGGLLAYPVALFIMGNSSAALFAYIIPFFISSAGGTIIAAVITTALHKTNIFKTGSGDKL